MQVEAVVAEETQAVVVVTADWAVAAVELLEILVKALAENTDLLEQAAVAAVAVITSKGVFTALAETVEAVS
jgi:hypothetical protein